jgi:hypothetical protein
VYGRSNSLILLLLPIELGTVHLISDLQGFCVEYRDMTHLKFSQQPSVVMLKSAAQSSECRPDVTIPQR